MNAVIAPEGRRLGVVVPADEAVAECKKRGDCWHTVSRPSSGGRPPRSVARLSFPAGQRRTGARLEAVR